MLHPIKSDYCCANAVATKAVCWYCETVALLTFNPLAIKLQRSYLCYWTHSDIYSLLSGSFAESPTDIRFATVRHRFKFSNNAIDCWGNPAAGPEQHWLTHKPISMPAWRGSILSALTKWVVSSHALSTTIFTSIPMCHTAEIHAIWETYCESY